MAVELLLFFFMFVLALVLSVGALAMKQQRLEMKLYVLEQARQEPYGSPQVYDPSTGQTLSLADFQGDPLDALQRYEQNFQPEPVKDPNGEEYRELGFGDI